MGVSRLVSYVPLPTGRRFVSCEPVPSSKSLWSAVKIAKYEEVCEIPNEMVLGDEKFTGDAILQAFAEYFENKVSNTTGACIVDETVHNGQRLARVHDEFIMDELKVKNVMMGLLGNRIDKSWLELGLANYKIKCKELFLSSN